MRGDKINYKIIATGSKGNAVLLYDRILIDCGIPFKNLKKSGLVESIQLVLLTHIHGDHFREPTIKQLYFERPSIRFCCCKWMVDPLLECGVKKTSIDVTRPTNPGESSQALIYNNLCIVSPEYLNHDVPNCGWHISHKYEHIFYATDTGTLDGIYAPNYDLYLIEANHKKEEIEERIQQKKETGEFIYEYRALRNHLSEEQALEWLSKNMGPNSKYVFLHEHIQKEDN